MSKVLTRKETGPALVAYLSVFVTLTIMIPALFVWREPSLEEWLWMGLTAGLATLGHLCMVQGLKSLKYLRCNQLNSCNYFGQR